MASYFSFAVSPVIVHVVVSNGSDYVSGLLGGLTALAGVLLAEFLVRVRERRRSLNAALDDMHAAAATYLGGILPGRTQAETQAAYSNFVSALGRVKAHARRPLRNAAAIRDEVDNIIARFAVVVARLARDGTVPKLGPVIGDRIHGLVMGGRKSSADKLDTALRDAGFDPAKYGPNALTEDTKEPEQPKGKV